MVAHLPGCTGHPPTFNCPACRALARAPRPDSRTLRRARTATSRATLAAGIHPATGLHLDLDHTCGQCVHCTVRRFDGGTAWFKCSEHRHGTHGADTDIRISWPACTLFRESLTSVS